MDDTALPVIIVTFNSKCEIDACLENLYADFERPATVIVVDNASVDGTAGHVASRWPQVTLLPQVENVGFAAANNIGLKCAASDPVLLLNPDTVIKPGAMKALLAAMEAHPDAAVVGPMLLNPDGSLQPSCREFPSLIGDLIGMTELYRVQWARRLLGRRLVSLGDHSRERRVDWLSGACLLVRRAAIDDVGPMDDRFFMYSEEMEWQYRMAVRGWTVWFEPRARVVHLGGASTAAVSGQRVVWQYQSIWRFYRQYRDVVQRLALHWIVWFATFPKIAFLALWSRGNSHRRELLRAFWHVLWLG